MKLMWCLDQPDRLVQKLYRVAHHIVQQQSRHDAQQELPMKLLDQQVDSPRDQTMMPMPNSLQLDSQMNQELSSTIVESAN